MGLFSLDIEKYYEELLGKDQQLKGMFCIQYPIYCIHSSITDVTADPLDNLDKVIVDFFISKSDFTPFQIGSLISTSKTLVELRISKLIQDALLVKNGDDYALSDEGIEVFKNKTQIRQHKQSYDFYLDGLTLLPLPKIFYTYYRSKFISENDTYYYTNARGETKLARPFGPDLVHTPPDKNNISNHIFSVEEIDRAIYNIPTGLVSIDEISYTKLTLQLLVSVSSKGNNLVKELIDGFAIYSLSENISYYDSVKKNVKIFESNLSDKIENLEFKISIPRIREDKKEQRKPMLTSNWPEIDKSKNSQNRCFNFSSEDLAKVVEQIFYINHVVPESIINEDSSVEISINKKMLLDSPNRQKLINDLIRERDYKFGNVDNNIFLLFLYFNTADAFVRNVLEFKQSLNKFNGKEINLHWVSELHPEYTNNYRNLLIVAGEYELLEKLDIEKYMLEFK